MPENFDQLRNALFEEAGQVTWKDASEVRQRGAARTRKTVLVAGLAALLVIGGGAAAGAVLSGRDGATPAPPGQSATASEQASPSPGRSGKASPSADPSGKEPTVEIPDRALLQPEDFGPGAKVGDKNGAGGDWILAYLFHAVCDAGMWTKAEGVANNVGTIDEPDGPGAIQTVNRYRGGEGRKYLTDLIATTDRCRSMTTSEGKKITLTQVDSDFAGDASILVKVDYGEPEVGIRWHVFVRQGELVTEIGSNGSEEQARALGAKAAARLCGATPTC